LIVLQHKNRVLQNREKLEYQKSSAWIDVANFS